MVNLKELESKCRKIAYAVIDAIHGEDAMKNAMSLVADNGATIEIDEEVVRVKIENASVGVWID